MNLLQKQVDNLYKDDGKKNHMKYCQEMSGEQVQLDDI